MRASIVKFLESHVLASISISIFICNFIYNWVDNTILIKNVQGCLINVILFNILYAFYKFMKDGKLTK